MLGFASEYMHGFNFMNDCCSVPPATNLAGIFGIYGVAVPYGASFVSAYIRTLIDECSHYYPDDGSRSSSHHNGKSS